MTEYQAIKTKKIKLLGYDLVLRGRTLGESIQFEQLSGSTSLPVLMASTISNCLQDNVKLIRRYRVLARRKMKEAISPNNLIDSLSYETLKELFYDILELDGQDRAEIKKKIETAEKEIIKEQEMKFQRML